MGLETFTYITSLNTANPLSSDQKSEGDDHIRGVKKAVKDSFPNVAGAVSPTHTELNYVDGVTSALQTQIDGKAASSHSHATSDITSLTASAAELNIMDGVTSTTAELNLLDGVTATTAEINYIDGVTSALQAQVDGKSASGHNHSGTYEPADATIAKTGAAQTFTAGQRGEVTALTDTATIATDLAASNNFSVTLAGNRTLANPTNCTAGQSGSYFISQDGTGSRTLAFGTYFKFVGGTAPTLSTTASAVDRIDYVVQSATAIHAVASLDVK